MVKPNQIAINIGIELNNNLTQSEENPLWDAERFFGKNKKSGIIVETKNGLIGRTYSDEEPINGKIRVYTNKHKILCDPETLKIKGFLD
jgi:hypothetical protein